MSDIKHKVSARSGNPISIMTTELNSLTSTGSALSSAVDNDTDLDLYMDIEGLFTFGTGPTAGSVLEVYLVSSLDATNFEDGSTTGPIVPANGYVGCFVLRSVTTAQRMIIRGVAVPPTDFKLMVVARTTGQTAAASGNTVRALFYKEQVA